MKTLLLIVDDETCREYEELSPETKQQCTHEISLLIRKMDSEARCAKLKQIIQDINNGHNLDAVNSELLMKLLPID